MSNRGGMQKQLSKILAEAQVQGYKIEDFIPGEMHGLFHGLTELKAAREYIKEVEGREIDLQAENNSLLAKIKAKEEEIENQPEEFKALKVDLQQAQRSIDYYRELVEDAHRRAERYQRNLQNAVKDQTASDEAAAKIERLQTELDQHQIAILKLQIENRKAAEIFDQLREQDAKVMADNSAKLAVVETESELFSETLTALIDTLETEHSSAAAAINDKSALLHKTEKLYNVIVSEVTPLNRFFSRTYEILAIYQALFQSLSDPHVLDIVSLPQQLDKLMDGASQDLDNYQGVHGLMLGDAGVAEEQVRLQLSGMALSAGDIFSSLQCIEGDVSGFLGRLHREPNTWLAMKTRFRLTGKCLSVG
ncbi:hypothetical protein EJ02DRAFT_344448 [Clathrospora elynae]|uniref:Uncharacterized protein n=1 Tax=Clathrospora elynae TaxID=706981 RepID=A0A6A5ST93_9PLEO|nr:hypothetical protein EJ02DRAFT_344448 [Clathrospora elynae]